MREMSVNPRIYEHMERMNDDQAAVLLMDVEGRPWTPEEQSALAQECRDIRMGLAIPQPHPRQRLRAAIEAMDEAGARAILAELEYEPGPLTIEDMLSIERGIADARAGRLIPHEEVMARLRSRLSER